MFFHRVVDRVKHTRVITLNIALSHAGASRPTRSRRADFWADSRGNVAIITALSMPVLVGAMGLGSEAGFWYYRQQAMQSAADSAAVAAASASGISFQQEARGVAAKYGLVNGQGNVSVETQNGVTCPTAPTGVIYSECYRVTITSLVPLFLSSVVGYQGNATAIEGGKSVPKTQLIATAIAARVDTPRKYCVVALGLVEVTDDIDANGAPKADLTGCGIMSNDGMRCVGAAEKFAEFADSPTGDGSPCGKTAHNLPSQKMADPYAEFAKNITSQPCSDSNTLNAPPAKAQICVSGDLTLTGHVEITKPTVIVIKGGKLDLDKYKLKGSALTIVFTGNVNFKANEGYIVGKAGSSLDITAPTTGEWAGVALYQDPAAQTVSFTVAGSHPQLNVKGLFYFPKAALTLSGAVNKDLADDPPCFIMMVGSLRLNGGGFAANSTKCTNLLVPSKKRGRLVG